MCLMVARANKNVAANMQQTNAPSGTAISVFNPNDPKYNIKASPNPAAAAMPNV